MAQTRITPLKVAGGGTAAVLLAAVGLIAGYEGKENATYLDIIKVPTACYGHTGPEVRMGQYHTDAECMEMLQRDVPKYAAAIDGCIKAPVPAASYAAFISFSYNVGPDAFCRSTLLRKLNAGDVRGACAELSKWTMAGGKVQKGLVNRRKAERAYCERGVQ